MPWALVTGGSGDIGRATCLRLARDGYDVALTTFRNVESAEEVADKVRAEGRQAVVLRSHLGKAGAADALAEAAIEACGTVDVVISNAASGVLKPVGELDERAFDWSMGINARPLLMLVAKLRPRAAVAMSSPGSTRVLPAYAVVGASKAALESLVRYLAVELAPSTRVNAISAGVVDTRALTHFPDREGMLADAEKRTPAGRLVTPEDVANAVAWLVSPEAAMVTGHTLVLDGGWSLTA
ncbi:MAG: enoyl-[acyl-carrier protein] reductase [Frankiaceae bacterium]|jgi:enoyl-[acyl-carrier protein] reductase III|nr:enoyl-[acyl-carrier protein] reductase [Frankiaceae bacterium]